MTINTLTKTFRNAETLITMGGRSLFHVLNDEGTLTIRLPESGKEYEIKEEFVLAVSERYRSLPQKERAMTSQYGNPVWENCPDMILAPYVARMIQYVDNLGD